MGRDKRIWYLSPMRAAKVQVSLCIRAVSPEPSLLAHTSSESRGTFRQKARFLAPLNGCTCSVKICHDGMLENTNSLDAPHMLKLNELHMVGYFSSFDTDWGSSICRKRLRYHKFMMQKMRVSIPRTCLHLRKMLLHEGRELRNVCKDPWLSCTNKNTKTSQFTWLFHYQGEIIQNKISLVIVHI